MTITYRKHLVDSIRRRWWIILVAVIVVSIIVNLGWLYVMMMPQTVDTSHIGGPYHVQSYRGGTPVNEKVIAEGSPQAQAFAEWLSEHRDGWSLSFVSYAPNWIVRGDGVSLNLLPDGVCVLNIQVNGTTRQFIRAIPYSDVAKLMAAFKRE